MLTIVYEDEHLLIVNKPSGLLCVPGLSDPDNLFDRVLKRYPNARVVHRLDMSTSGMVIFALNHPAQKRLGHMFEHKKIQKRYIAELSGQLDHKYGEVASPLICDWVNRPVQKVDWLKGKLSLTHYRVIEQSASGSRVELTPITGRTHQLRLHMLQIGHPILGDNFYNIENSHMQAERLMLHAFQLQFAHPVDASNMAFECKPEF